MPLDDHTIMHVVAVRLSKIMATSRSIFMRMQRVESAGRSNK